MVLDPDTLDLLPVAARVHEELGERVSLRGELAAAQIETASPVCDSIDEAAAALDRGAPRARRRGGGLGAPGRLGHASLRRPRGPAARPPPLQRAEGRLPVGDRAADGVRPPHPRRGPRRRPRAGRAQRGALLPPRPRGAGGQRAAARRPRHRARLAAAPDRRPAAAPGHAAGRWARGTSTPTTSRGGAAAASSPPRASRGGRRAATTSWGRSSCACPTPRRRPRRRPGCSRSAPGSSRGWPSATTPASRCRSTTPIRISDNRWRALRHGLNGSLLDLDSGEQEPTRARVLALIDRVAPAAERLGGAAALEHARTLAARNGAERQRATRRRARPATGRRGARRGVPAMRANVGAQTCDRGRYA